MSHFHSHLIFARPLLFAILLLSSCSSQNDFLEDLDGNRYATVEQNGLVWMAENLRTTRDRAGESVNFYYPDSSEQNAAVYGLLYDYPTACQVCPEGWRLPNNEEWESLIGPDMGSAAARFKDPDFWEGEENGNGSGFSIRPAGYGNNGDFDNYFGSRAILFSGTPTGDHDVWTIVLEEHKPGIRMALQHPIYGFSVRCVKEK